MSHIFGAKKETLSVPYLTEFTLRQVRTLFPRKLIVVSFHKISFIRGGERPCKNLYVSVARIFIFLWCIVAELSFSSKFWKDDNLSLYVILIALSCIRFILLLKLRLWNIQTNGQYKNCDSIITFHYHSFFINVHERWKTNKNIKFLTYFFAEIIDMFIKFQVSVNCYS